MSYNSYNLLTSGYVIYIQPNTYFEQPLQLISRERYNRRKANSTAAEDHIPASFKVDQIEGLHYACDNTTAPQNHFIYCSGRILQAVQAFKLFEDSKTFVDKPMKYSPLEVLQKFEERFPEDENITKEALQEFVDENFEGTCHELADCELEDWNPNPPSFKDIANQDYFKWATGLNDIWKKLCRKMNPEIKNAPERYSLIYVEHPFVVPGGRFREFYYWDSYWTIKGLLVSGMYKTVEHMLMNFASMVEQYGMIPNGGRVYYLTRSQPPLLAGMFLEYYKASGNKKFVEKYLPVLEKEFQFWNSSRRVDVKLKSGETHSVFQYRADSDAPRPESFREDVEIIKQLTSDSKKKTVWKDLASAAESGWDFSSRWFADKLSLATIETTNVVPVDLNAYICWNLKILRQFHDEISGNKEKVDQFGKLLDAHRSALQAVFFVDNENQTGWFDYNLRSEVHNFEFYPSSVTPLFTKVVENLGAEMEEKIYNNMKLKGAFSEDGGVPTRLPKKPRNRIAF
uniref:Trehalase n=1 Tax=Bursaphelenchus xylophilus TaxID=6326 RepID=A0A7T3TYE1_BURXY|nr:trehalase [Bursaphelenchus xylophilus]